MYTIERERMAVAFSLACWPRERCGITIVEETRRTAGCQLDPQYWHSAFHFPCLRKGHIVTSSPRLPPYMTYVDPLELA